MPEGISAEQLVDLNVKYAKMIKSADPDAKVIGLSAWSAVDLAGSNVDFTPPGTGGYKRYGEVTPDQQWRERKKHGNRSQLEYYLDEMKAAEQKHGKRLIDVIDVHWYPYTYGADSDNKLQRLSENLAFDPKLAEQQFDALGEWYDPSYQNPSSWMADATNKPYLWDPYHPVIPALKKIIEAHYPGTKLAFNEYAAGSHAYFHGALMQAALYGIFMQEDIYMAQAGHQDNEGESFMYLVQKLVSNYDGKGGAVRGDFYKSTSSNKDLLSFVTNDGNRWHVLVVNKNPKLRMKTTLDLPKRASKFKTLLFSESLNRRILPTSERQAKNQRLTFFVPAYSAALVIAN